MFHTLKEAEYEKHNNAEWRALKACLRVSGSRRLSLPLPVSVCSHTAHLHQRRGVAVEQAEVAATDHFIFVVSIHAESITKCLELGADTLAGCILGSPALSWNANHFIPEGYQQQN